MNLNDVPTVKGTNQIDVRKSLKQMNMKRRFKVWWRWLSRPVPPEGMKYADNPNLPGFAPTNVQPDTQEHINEVQAEMHAHQGREFYRLNEMQNKIAKHIHANYGEDQASGLHARIGGDLSDLVIYYLRRERWLQKRLDSMTGQFLDGKNTIVLHGEEPTV